ncbi:hypothetical protein CMO89_02075 [Candidatus Woesearchaeota archaeon]|nr:hypothetical protein [Candidatus Woesearchaeota archaeon]|tara:strand:- start:4939 stop:5433 length:495 start_codon:yes stop_codon:yes gene_type:complete
MDPKIQVVIGVGFNENEIYSGKHRYNSTQRMAKRIRDYANKTSDPLERFNTVIGYIGWLFGQDEKFSAIGICGSWLKPCVVGSIAQSLLYKAEVFVNPGLCMSGDPRVNQMNLEDKARQEIADTINSSLDFRDIEYRRYSGDRYIIYTSRPNPFFLSSRNSDCI